VSTRYSRSSECHNQSRTGLFLSLPGKPTLTNSLSFRPTFKISLVRPVRKILMRNTRMMMMMMIKNDDDDDDDDDKKDKKMIFIRFIQS
jgi:hypothetical protein